jgi:hypothetical protein
MPAIHDTTARLAQGWNDGDAAFQNTRQGAR